MWWQDLWDSTDVCSDDKEAAACGLEDGNAERFGEAGVQEDVTSAENITNLVMAEATKQLNTTMDVVFFNQLLQLVHPRAVTTNDEVYILKLGQDLGDDTNQEVNSFSVLQSADKHDINLVWIA